MLRSVIIGMAAAAVVGSAVGAQRTGLPRWPVHAVIAVWLDPGTAPSGAGVLVEKALATWTQAADGRFELRKAASREAAQVRVSFPRADGIYGEAMPRVDRTTGNIASADVHIAADVGGDLLQQRLVIYLTALHELGHALGLPHTNAFDDIMYSFRRPDDGERYFGAYRRRLRSSDDIGTDRATGLSPADISALRSLYDR